MILEFRPVAFLILLTVFVNGLYAQYNEASIDTVSTEEPEFNKKRFWITLGTGSVIYGAGTYALAKYWYSDYGFTSFHFYNDLGEWRHMDKIGHVYGTYNQSSIAYDAARWIGMSKNTSLWAGVSIGMLVQSTIEVMDGLVPKWGFSISDMGANVAGAGLFIAQQKLWDEQKILIKVSSGQRNYSLDPFYSVGGNATSSLQQRANSLFGRSYPERFLKDYNAQTYWFSFNLASLLGNENIPPWLNISLGYGAENMFGGYGNTWTDKDGNFFDVSSTQRRYSQFYITPDIDFNRIKTNSQFARTLFKALNLIKLPMPGIEVNTLGEVRFHFLIVY